MAETQEAIKSDKYIAGDGLYAHYIKRHIGFMLALILMLILLPIFLSIALAVYLDDGFPVFYRPYRGGYYGRAFRIVKFRTMVKNADIIGGGTTALKDKRITRVGYILRKTKLDELPQLINIIKGEMSFVGPRPELLQYTETYTREEKNILSIRPGITDFGSIELVNLDEIVGCENADAHYEKFVLKKKNALRLKYLEEVSFQTDAHLVCITIRIVFGKAIFHIFDRNRS